MVSRINSMGLMGINGFMVSVEADLSQGLPGFDVVGLPGAAVRESRDRVRAALKNNGFTYPVSRVTVNLAPADVRKEGPLYDLPLLLGTTAITFVVFGLLYALVYRATSNAYYRLVSAITKDEKAQQ